MKSNFEKILEDIRFSVVSNVPLVYIHTSEHKRGGRIIQNVVNGLEIDNVISWSESTGLEIKLGELKSTENHKLNFIELMHYLVTIDQKTILLIQNIHNYLDTPENISALLYAIDAMTKKETPISMISLSSKIIIPEEVVQYTTLYSLPFPTRTELKHILDEILKKYNIHLDRVTKNFFVESLNGLSEDQSEVMIYSTISKTTLEKRHINNDDVNIIVKEKRQIINKSGIIEAIDNDNFKFDDIGGLLNLKAWMRERKQIFTNMSKAKKFGVTPPKGLFMFGMPGVGKSLTSKVIAAYYNLPLLKLDMGIIYGQESPEAGINYALKLANTIAPCVLWVDEVEKAFAGTEAGKNGSETAMRVFGQVLTWMEENVSPVLTVATANDISNIRPELIRRFDQMFFIDFPSKTSEIKDIYEIHLKRRLEGSVLILEEIDYNAVHKKMKQVVNKYGGSEEAGYSGSDIEKIVKEVLTMAYTSGLEKISTRHFIEKINSIRPQRGDTIAALKKKSKELDAIEA